MGATENIMRSRQLSLWAWVNMMPMPRSKPSTTTYIVMATPRIAAQSTGSQKAQPWYSIPKPNMPGPSLFGGLWGGGLASRFAAQALVGEREGPLRLLSRAAGTWNDLDGIGPFAQDLRQVVAAESEDDRVDHQERLKRDRDGARRDRRD